MNIQEALAAVRDNPPHRESPLPWQDCDSEVLAADASRVCDADEKDAACIAAAVNAAPVLAAEVERLQGLLAAARVAVDVWPVPAHSFYCGYWLGPEGYDSRLCDCDVEQRKGDRTHARRAVGLEGSHG